MAGYIRAVCFSSSDQNKVGEERGLQSREGFCTTKVCFLMVAVPAARYLISWANYCEIPCAGTLWSTGIHLLLSCREDEIIWDSLFSCGNYVLLTMELSACTDYWRMWYKIPCSRMHYLGQCSAGGGFVGTLPSQAKLSLCLMAISSLILAWFPQSSFNYSRSIGSQEQDFLGCCC